MRPHAGSRVAGAAIVAGISALAGAAGPPSLPSQVVAEIDFLLASVGTSGCDFSRNGSWYSAERAQAHLNGKYHWLLARNRITTAEDFIELVATRSSLTGHPYAVRCAGGIPVSSHDWLAEQLRRYRDAREAPRPGRGAPAVQSSNEKVNRLS